MKTSRRSFLKTAAVTPLILSSSAWAAETAPTRRLTMGFIGMGKQSVGKQSGGLLTQFLYRTQVLAVCDVDTTRRNNALQKVNEFYTNNPDQGKPDCKAYVDFEELLARKDIDAVCIATPDHWHAIITLAALKAGKDVYCEKPLTHNIAEAFEVMKAVDENKRVLQNGSMQRSMQEFRVACELARNGILGKIERVDCFFGDPSIPCNLPEEPMEPGLDWNMWVGPAPMRPYNSILSPRGVHNHFPMWRAYREFGGGMVCDWGAHHLDIAQWGLDMDQSGPVEILPPKSDFAKRDACLVYANGVQVWHKEGDLGIHFFGTEGDVFVGRSKIDFTLGGKTAVKFTSRQDGGTLDSKLAMIERDFLKDAKVRLYKSENHIDDFLKSIESRKKPITHEEIGARSAVCCHLMNLAYQHRQPMKWDPAKFEFVGGTGDPAWLSENYRNYRA